MPALIFSTHAYLKYIPLITVQAQCPKNMDAHLLRRTKKCLSSFQLKLKADLVRTSVLCSSCASVCAHMKRRTEKEGVREKKRGGEKEREKGREGERECVLRERGRESTQYQHDKPVHTLCAMCQAS